MPQDPSSGPDLASVITTLTLTQNLLLIELSRSDPEAAQRVVKGLKGYADFVEDKHGEDSPDAKSTRSTVKMLTLGLSMKDKGAAK